MNEGSVFSLVLVLVVGKYLSVACLRSAGLGGGGNVWRSESKSVLTQ